MADKNAVDLDVLTTLADADTFLVIDDTDSETKQITKANVAIQIIGANADTTDLDKLADVTSSAAELNILDGVTANAADLNIMAGQAAAGLTGTELKYVNGVTSNIQTQLDSKVTTTTDKFNSKRYTLEYETGGAETTIVIDADDILTALGYSAANYYVFPGYTYNMVTGTLATTTTSLAKSTNFTTTKKLISGSTYGIDKITISSLSTSTAYVVTLNVTVVPKA